jgi:hypothetical protein
MACSGTPFPFFATSVANLKLCFCLIIIVIIIIQGLGLLTRFEIVDQINLSYYPFFSTLEWEVASPLPVLSFYSILIRLLEPSSNEVGETWVKNMASEFRLQIISFMLERFFHMP